MLPPAALVAAERLVAILVTLVRAVTETADDARRPIPSRLDTHALFAHLSDLVLVLMRLCTDGLRAPANPTPANPTPAGPAQADPADAAPTFPASLASAAPAAPRLPALPAFSFPTTSGWLLAALPGLAPDLVDDLRALLADPGLAALLAATPAIAKALDPVLHGLGLARPRHAAPDPAPPQTRPDPAPSAGPARTAADQLPIPEAAD